MAVDVEPAREVVGNIVVGRKVDQAARRETNRLVRAAVVEPEKNHEGGAEDPQRERRCKLGKHRPVYPCARERPDDHR